MNWEQIAEFLKGAGIAHLATALVEDEGGKRGIWESRIFPFDLAESFGTPTNPEHLFIKVRPVSALVVSQDPDGLTPRRWPAHRGVTPGTSQV